MMSDATATEEEATAAPTGELTELARLEIRIGKIVEVRERAAGWQAPHFVISFSCFSRVVFHLSTSMCVFLTLQQQYDIKRISFVSHCLLVLGIRV